MAAPLLSIDRLCVRFDSGAPAVDGVSLTIEAGQSLGIIGESGSGKSAIAMAIMRLLPPQAAVSGGIRFLNQSLLNLPDSTMRSIRGRQIALIPQHAAGALNPVTRIGRQLDQTIAAHDPAGDDPRPRGDRLLREMGFADPATIRRAFPHRLSGGMRQRVLTALGVASGARLLIADEPTKGLDAPLRRQVIDSLRRAARHADAALLLITHDLDVARALCGRIAVMQAGRIVETAATQALFAAPRTDATRRLIADWPANLPAKQPQPSPQPPVLIAEGLDKSYASRNPFRAGTAAVAGASLALRPRETVALVGASGSGKSTLGRMLAGLLRPDRGQLLLDGVDARAMDARHLHRSVQIILQHPETAFDPQRRLIASLAEPLLLHRLASKAQARDRAVAQGERLGLPAPLLHRYPHQLSGGEIQRAALARALMLDPRVLILDEPTSMLDSSTQARIVALLRAEQDRRGLACLFITHDLDLAAHIADAIAVMRDGRIVERR